MKRFFKRFLLLLLLAFIVIQFFRPTKNKSAITNVNDITQHYYTPKHVQKMLYEACYDCHSDNTRYPWYAEIQPVAWWLDDHVKDGKKELNFSLFKSYSPRRQYRKAEEIISEVEEKKMPLDSYTWIHRDADLEEKERKEMMAWAQSIRDTLEARYPMDSLVAPKKK